MESFITSFRSLCQNNHQSCICEWQSFQTIYHVVQLSDDLVNGGEGKCLGVIGTLKQPRYHFVSEEPIELLHHWQLLTTLKTLSFPFLFLLSYFFIYHFKTFLFRLCSSHCVAVTVLRFLGCNKKNSSSTPKGMSWWNVAPRPNKRRPAGHHSGKLGESGAWG